MGRIWRYLFGGGPARVRSAPKPAVVCPPTERGMPDTFGPADDPPGVERPRVFEPALMHYPNGVRAGEPRFDDPETARAWRAWRRYVTGHVLRIVARSRWRDHLVLRGSVPLKSSTQILTSDGLRAAVSRTAARASAASAGR